MSNGVDITIVGAGVVGLAVAAELARDDRQILVLEKNERFGGEQSCRNSEVIHAGIYYEQDSLKARLCLEGNRLLYEICQENGIAFRKCGKIVVATNSLEDDELYRLFEKGKDNGVPLKMLSRREMTELEPNLVCSAAFFSPTTGIVDSFALMKYFSGKAVEKGAKIAYGVEVTGIAKTRDRYEVTVKEASGPSSLITSVLINCAGLNSDRVAAMAGIDVAKEGYALHWLKGEYYAVGNAKNRLINRLVYPVPLDISVGVHVCLDVGGRLRLGPLFYYVDKLDYAVNDARRVDFLRSSIMKALPVIAPDDLEPESSGIMAMLQGKGEAPRDFVISHEKDKGLPGVVNLVGIDSPGLTCSAAIARYVKHIVDNEVM